MTEDELNAIEQRANAATPGPWCVVHQDDELCMNLYAVAQCGVDVDTEAEELQDVICGTLVQTLKTIRPNPRRAHSYPGPYERDAVFIAAAREDVSALVYEVRRLQRIEKALTSLISHDQADIDDMLSRLDDDLK